jgi:hypothetical protein
MFQNLFKKPMRDSKLFDKAVMRFFEPIAQQLGLPISKIRDGVYEMPSPHFIMRIRLHDGHRRGLNVILRSAMLKDFGEDKPDQQYDISCFMLFHGEDLKQIIADVNTDADFIAQAELLAGAVNRFGIPYLLGQKNDFEAIREFMKKRGEPEMERIKQMQRNIERNMPSVRQEWTIPEDKMPQ